MPGILPPGAVHGLVQPMTADPGSRHLPAVCVFLATAARAQLITTDAGVISPAVVLAKERFEWWVLEDADEFRATTTLSFAPEPRLQFDLSLPLAVRDVDVPGSGTRLQGRQEGLGDMELGAKWALLRADDVMRSDRLSVLGGVRLPTADDDSDVDALDIGPRGALGLDRLGGALGLGYTLVRDRHRAAVALRGWAWETRDGLMPGHELTLDAAWWYRLAPREFVPRVDQVEWRGVIELLARWQQDDDLAGADQRNGGMVLTAVLGVQSHVTPSLSFDAGILLPIDDTTDPVFGELRAGFLFSFRLLF